MAIDREPHVPDLEDYRNGMALPPAKTCGDCAHFSKCQWLISRIAADQLCDWSPSRFQPLSEGGG
jgi:hypothetical protein